MSTTKAEYNDEDLYDTSNFLRSYSNKRNSTSSGITADVDSDSEEWGFVRAGLEVCIFNGHLFLYRLSHADNLVVNNT